MGGLLKLQSSIGPTTYSYACHRVCLVNTKIKSLVKIIMM